MDSFLLVLAGAVALAAIAAVLLLFGAGRALAAFVGTMVRVDLAVLRTYIVGVTLVAADIWVIGECFFAAFLSEPVPLFAEEPARPLYMRLLPLAAIVIGLTITTAASSSSESSRNYLRALATTSVLVWVGAVVFLLVVGASSIG